MRTIGEIGLDVTFKALKPISQKDFELIKRKFYSFQKEVEIRDIEIRMDRFINFKVYYKIQYTGIVNTLNTLKTFSSKEINEGKKSKGYWEYGYVYNSIRARTNIDLLFQGMD